MNELLKHSTNDNLFHFYLHKNYSKNETLIWILSPSLIFNEYFYFQINHFTCYLCFQYSRIYGNKNGMSTKFKILPLIVLTFEISASVSSTSSSIPSNLATACNGYSSATETPSVSSMGINTILARCNMAAKIRKITWICCKRTIRFS